MGIHRACPEAEIIGVDIVNQPRYPFQFRLANALHYPLEGFDFIWASPPCQAYSVAAMNNRRNGTVYDDLLEPTRKRLRLTGVAWTIENVPGAPMRPDVILCGSNFGLPIVRHRLFELSFDAPLTPSCSHGRDTLTICGHGTPQWTRKKRIREGLHPNVSVKMKRAAMETPWMNRAEMSQAVPPAYSEFIFRQWLAQGARGA
jgi:DNA (cytosine-5)-methyltransferase 1